MVRAGAVADGTPDRVLLVFLDGIGLADADPAFNAFAAAQLPCIRDWLGGKVPVVDALGPHGTLHSARAVLVAADATLGMPGLPQSGTGQTALLSGLDAARLFGRHFGPWVPTVLREPLAEQNLLCRAVCAGRSAAFANAYPAALRESDGRRPIAPPLVARAAGLLTRGPAQLCTGDAVASSITNERWQAHLGADAVPAASAAQAGRNLARIAADAEVTLFAHYDTDHAGHRGDLRAAVRALEKVDRFFGGLLDELSADTLLVVASDHGNLEDARTGHTRNPVPVLAGGPGRHRFAERVRSIADVAPAISELLNIS